MQPGSLFSGPRRFCKLRQSSWNSINGRGLYGVQPQGLVLHQSSPLVGGRLALTPGLRYRNSPSSASRRIKGRSLPTDSGLRRVKFAGRKRLKRSHSSDDEIKILALECLDKLQKFSKQKRFMLQTGLSEENAVEKFKEFDAEIRKALKTSLNEESSPLLQTIKQEYIRKGPYSIDEQVKYALQSFLANQTFSQQDINNQIKVADLRYPYEWFPGTRALQRKLHLHIGPTNSGKTYHALQRLEAAASGMYAGPLRLLAHEVYMRLNARGKKCNLITGDEMIFNSSEDELGPAMNACTVEMVPYQMPVAVGIIDEIQMIGDRERGWAWTQAILGMKAKELHMCGEERALPLVRELAAATGEELIVHRYERLSPLKAADSSLKGSLKKLRSGDCVVSFSRNGIHALRQEIQRQTRRPVAIVYGSLPPEVRAQQARLFNDESNDYDVLVASDAIGMGLNLNIKRIVFESTFKFDGTDYAQLGVPQIKQIAGRAGRYRTAAQATEAGHDVDASRQAKGHSSIPNVGIVTTLEDIDLPIVRKSMTDNAAPITTAGLLPPDYFILRFASYFPPQTPFSYILRRLHEVSRMNKRFHLCVLRDQIKTADIIQLVPTLGIADRLTFSAAPTNPHVEGMEKIILAFAQCIARQSGGQLLDIKEIDLEILDVDSLKPAQYLGRLETTHKAVVLYLWLSYRFPSIFPSQSMGFYVKNLLQEKIDKVLEEQGPRSRTRKELRKKREAAVCALMDDGDEETDADRESATDPQEESGEEPISELVDNDIPFTVENNPREPGEGTPSGTLYQTPEEPGSEPTHHNVSIPVSAPSKYPQSFHSLREQKTIEL